MPTPHPISLHLNPTMEPTINQFQAKYLATLTELQITGARLKTIGMSDDCPETVWDYLVDASDCVKKACRFLQYAIEDGKTETVQPAKTQSNPK